MTKKACLRNQRIIFGFQPLLEGKTTMNDFPIKAYRILSERRAAEKISTHSSLTWHVVAKFYQNFLTQRVNACQHSNDSHVP
jgi:hypothetical protein